MSLTRLEKLLKTDAPGTLGNIVRRARATSDLTRILQSALAAEAAPHLLAANVREDGELVLICSSSSWASRIRFESEALLEAAGKHGLGVDRCVVKVARR